MRTFAEYIAFYIENEGCEDISMKSAEIIFGNMVRDRGYTRPDSKVCINLLVEMGILEREENRLFFSSSVYQEYFLNEFLDD